MSCDLIPTGQVGTWAADGQGTEVPFFTYYLAVVAYTCYDRTGDPNWLPMGEYLLRSVARFASDNVIGDTTTYYAYDRPSGWNDYNPVTNDWFPEGYYPMVTGVSISSATGRMSGPSGPYPFTVGDVVVASDIGFGFSHITPPTELTLGTRYYVVETDGSTYIRISDTPGGTPINFSSNYTNSAFGIRRQTSTTVRPPYNVPGYFTKAHASIIMGRLHSHPAVTDDVLNAYNTERAKFNMSSDPSWDFSV
jgi:hypothetical protein